MKYTKYSYLSSVVAGSILTYILSCQNNLVLAQISPDNTLGESSSQVNDLSDTEKAIEGGATKGENLFHSFKEFNVGEGEVVNFANPENITNIFGRVTGQNISQILGDLGVSGDANLFLMNPNGIIFGEKASLNVNGSFVATTANSINFVGGSQFIAQGASEKPLLTVNVPIGLQFDNQPGKIINRAQSPRKANSNGQFNSLRNPAGLMIQPEQTLALIGGDILLEGGNLTAIGGNIQLGSVGTNSLVGLSLNESEIIFDYSAVNNFLDIKLTNRDGFIETIELDENNRPILDENGLPISIILESPVPSILDVNSEDRSGSINLQGSNIDLLNGSQLQALAFGNVSGGTLVINAEEQLTISGRNFYRNENEESFPVPSLIFSPTLGSADAGDIAITTKRLIIRDFARIDNGSSSIFNLETREVFSGTGNAGNLNINASESISIANGRLVNDRIGETNDGSINLQTGSLILTEGSTITVNNEGIGEAGNINIQAQSLSLDGNSSISALAGQSNGGNINLEIDNNIELRNQSNISASVRGTGNGGNINIATEFLITSPQDNSDLTASAEGGNGGNISIDASGVFGLKIQNEATDFSEINTGSNFGTDGTVTLLNTDLQTDAINSEDEVQLVESAIEYTPNYCYANKQNRYIRAGRGGIPLDSTTMLIPQYTWEDWRIIETEDSQVVTTNNLVSENNLETQNKNTSLTPIQGWFVNERGKVVLTANPIIVVPHPQKSQFSGC